MVFEQQFGQTVHVGIVRVVVHILLKPRHLINFLVYIFLILNLILQLLNILTRRRILHQLLVQRIILQLRNIVTSILNKIKGFINIGSGYLVD